MKKILLFVLLFTSFTFYSQIADLPSDCNSINQYDLTRQYPLLIGNLDPNQTIISYHLSLLDATNGINAIAYPEYYNSSEFNQIIYARINNAGVITLNYFNLVIGHTIIFLEIHDPSSIGENDGMAYIHITNTSDPSTPYRCSLIRTNDGEMIDSFNTYESNLILFQNLAPGDYQFTMIDRYDCYKMVKFKIADTYLNFTTSSTDKTITIVATGGFPPYQYFIDNNTTSQSSNIFSKLTPGIHTITVTDSSDRKTTRNVFIEKSILLNATICSKINCFGDNNGSITINATGGDSPYTYSQDSINYDSNNILPDSGADTYTLYVKDANGCISMQEVTLYSIKDIWWNPILSITNVSCNGGNDGSILFDTDNKYAGTYTYEINGSTPQTGNIISGLSAGTYFVGVTNSNAGCGTRIQITITEPATPLSFTTEKTNVSCSNKGSITLNATGGQEPYTYSKDGVNYNSNNLFSDLNEGTYTVYTKDSNGCVSKEEVTLYRLKSPKPFHLSVQNVSCKGFNDGKITLDFMDTTGQYTYKIDGDTAINGNTFSGLSVGEYRITAINSNPECLSYAEDILITEPGMISATIVVESQNIIMTTTGGTGLYEYSLDGSKFQSRNVFNNAFYGIHEIAVKDQNGCMVILSVSTNPPAPLIDGKDTLTVEFTSGQTLEDLVVEGQNIKWYSSQNPLTSKTGKKAETTLPLTTVLVDGTTYYASQTIDGIESKERLAVTAKLSGSLSAPDFVLPDFSYYPNPVKHSLSINNSSNIDEVEVFSVSGKSVLSKKINNTHSEIDLSNVASGFYFLKVTSEGKTKTIKIVKK